jgi:cytochrome c-type biogenesis protein CcmE
VLNGEAPTNKIFRIGGLVKVGSVQRNGTDVSFVVTDTAQDIAVRYSGLLPDLFTEGKGVVAQGRLDTQGLLTATEVLAKHDENYMPPEAQHALDKAAQARAAQSVKP